MNGSEDLTTDQKAVLLVLSSIPKKYKKSRVYFEKFLFLVTKNFPEKLDYLDSTFESYKYGPYNEYAEEVLDSLKDFGLIDKSNDFSPKGMEIFEAIKMETEIKALANKVEGLSEMLKDMNIDDILYVTYNLYPDFTDKSLIRSKIKSDKMETFKVDVSKFKNHSEIVIRSDKGSSVKMRKVDSRLEITED